MRSVHMAVFLALAAFAAPGVQAGEGTIVRTLSETVALYTTDGVERRRASAKELRNLPASEKNVSWLIVSIGQETFQLRRGDVVFESAATDCVLVKAATGDTGVGMAGSRAGTNAGAGAGGSVCVRKGS